MECLTPAFNFDIFMDNYFTSFCLTEIDYVNTLSFGEIATKKGTWPLRTAHIKQKSNFVTLTVQARN